MQGEEADKISEMRDDDPRSRKPCAMLFGATPVDAYPDRRSKEALSEPPAHVLREMNGALRQAYEKIRNLLVRASRDEVRCRYEVGLLVAEVKQSEHKYGARAVPLLGAALGTGVQTLYRCATVAERWTERQVEALLEQTNQHGQPLSWSHFVALSSVSPLRRRAELADRTLREGLSVRQVATLAEAKATSRKADGALEKLLAATERWWSLASAFYDQVFEELEMIAGGDARALELLDTTIAAHEAQQSRIGCAIERLRAERARLSAPGVKKAEGRLPETIADVGT
jgi:hypothetical protein